MPNILEKFHDYREHFYGACLSPDPVGDHLTIKFTVPETEEFVMIDIISQGKDKGYLVHTEYSSNCGISFEENEVPNGLATLEAVQDYIYSIREMIYG